MRNQLTDDRDNWIVTEIKRLRQELTEGKFNQPLTIERLDAGTFGPYIIPNNEYSSLVITLTSTNDKVLLLPPAEITFYKTSVLPGNRYPFNAGMGGNWTDAEVLGFNYDLDFDYHQSDGKNIKLILTMKNQTGSSIDIYFGLSVRYIKGTA